MNLHNLGIVGQEKGMANKIKTFFTFLISFAVCFISAQAQQASYQAIIKDADNKVVADSKISLRISLLQGSETGALVYQEIQKTVTNASGSINLQIGGGETLVGNFASIDWVKGPYYLKTETNLKGSSKFKEGDNKLIVAYALYAVNTTKDSAATAAVNKKLPPKPHYLGEFFGGGVIFYLYKDADGKEHGLIVSPSDLSSGHVWSNVSAVIGSMSESTFDGRTNTRAIIAQQDHQTSAALLCDTSTIGGETDWYLPSMQELNMLWNNLNTVNKVLASDGDETTTPIVDDLYWSSTEDDTTTFAWYFGMYDSGPVSPAGTNYKSELYHVRAIRSF